ncbi:MAG: 6-phosphogluconolactonase [Methylococcales bacterium]|nr:6-phosphogluconolactonase [Methylococcales bacterium]
MQIIQQWHCFESPAQVAQAACDAIMRAAQQAIVARGCFKLVLAGGLTPERVYQLLAKQQSDWSKWRIYYGDDRCLPADHPQRNSVMAQRAFLDHVSIPSAQVFTMLTELGNLQAARLYQQVVADAMPFDLVLLGMGDDGHTASLFPDHDTPSEALVHAVFNAPKFPPERISLSATALSNTRRVFFMITGAEKQTAVQQWKSGVQLPVSHIAPAEGIEIYIDSAALG